eukprot:scaffold87983_cov75-Phaeocystis_antarctica.AAC.4
MPYERASFQKERLRTSNWMPASGASRATVAEREGAESGRALKVSRQRRRSNPEKTAKPSIKRHRQPRVTSAGAPAGTHTEPNQNTTAAPP